MAIVSSFREMLDKVMELVLKDAENKKLDAGYSGRWDDGGALALEEQVKYYKLGMAAAFPPAWEKYKLQLDPEYLEYLRLRKKFG